MCLILQGTRFQVQVLKPCKSIEESSEKVLDFKTGQLVGHMWIMLGTYVNVKLANPLTKHTLLVIG